MASAHSVDRFGIIGGSGVVIEGKDPWLVKTPFGNCLLTALDEEKRVLYANRHLCTTIDESTGKATYAPPHEVNYQALIWALAIESGCKGGIVAIGSTGTLNPDTMPVGCVVMPDDYYMVRPEPVTFWGNGQIGTFETPAENGVGRIHYTPADTLDSKWLAFRKRMQAAVGPAYASLSEQVKLARGQTPDNWPLCNGGSPGASLEDSVVYVNTIGPRFETRAEIRAYRGVGHVVGMTCAREWALCEELSVPYALICFCDNACNGLSTHPAGALQEYLDHKKSISEVTGAVVQRLVADLSADSNKRPRAEGQ